MSLAGVATCPDCRSSSLRQLGQLPDVAFFAGCRLANPLPGGHLLRCLSCDLRFRYPRLTRERYDALYDNARVDAWISKGLRRDQELVLQVVTDVAARTARRLRLLDFGCYAGEFLAALPPSIDRLGVEVNRSAAQRAAMHAGARVESTLDDFDAEDRFDVIVMMDVIEHVESPRDLLNRLAARLSPGGSLVITTGDGGNWMWRWLGGRWWYCYFPEHIAFVSRHWLRHHARSLGLSIERVCNFNYLRRGEGRRFDRCKAMLRYLLRPASHAQRQQRHFAHHGADLGVPGLGLTQDHLLVVLSKS